MPTLNGYRRRGYTPESIKDFCEEIGVTRKTATVVPIEKLEGYCREHLNYIATRAFAIFDPIKVTLANYEGGVVDVECPNIPGNEEVGTHIIPFSGTFLLKEVILE
jgi:glutaminyl-tRNA synthetase